MHFTADTLLSLTEKSLVREYLWTPDNKLAYLTKDSKGVHFADLHAPLGKQAEIPCKFAAELEALSGAFVAGAAGVYGLSSEGLTLHTWNKEHTKFQAVRAQELIFWSQSQAKKLALGRTAPAAGIGLDPRQRWLSWICDFQDGQQLLVHSLSQKQRVGIPALRVSGPLRNVRWHPDRALALYITWPAGEVAWEASQLFLADYDLKEHLPQLREAETIAPLASHTPSMSCAEATFSPCGRFVIGLFRTGEWHQFWSYEISKKLWQQLSFREAEHARSARPSEQSQFALHPSLPLIIGIAAVAGTSSFVCYQYDQLETPIPFSVPKTRDTYLEQPKFSPDGKQLSVMSASHLSAPGLRSWLRDTSDWYDAHRVRMRQPFRGRMHSPLRVDWPSIDGETVHGILYRPFDKLNASPLIVAVHSGPVEQAGAGWPAKARFFNQLGFALLYVNYRGSFGYGTRYQSTLQGQWGIIDTHDIASAVESLARQGLINPHKLGLWGGAAGGTSVLNTLSAYPDLFQAAVAVYPYLDLNDALGRCSGLRRAELRWALGDLNVAEIAARSPLLRAGSIKTPLSLFHGAEDPLVPVGHAHILHDMLAEQGNHVRLRIYEQEAHGFKQTATRLDYAQNVADFFIKFLSESPAPSDELKTAQLESKIWRQNTE